MGIDLGRLKEPFPEKEIKWRVQQQGEYNGNPWATVLAYIESRTLMDRLDEVVGAENWTNRFERAPEGGILCTIGIKTNGTDEWIYKTDGAENTKVEAIKGGLSDAFKRAGVQWGVCRYLYRLPHTFAKFDDNGKYKTRIEGQTYKWNPPQLIEFGKEFLPPEKPNKTKTTNKGE